MKEQHNQIDYQSLVFDIGNVFVTWDIRNLYVKLIKDPVELDYFLTNIVTMAWHTEHDIGRTFDDNIDSLIKRFPHYETLIRLYKTRWFETIGGEIEGMAGLLADLVKRYPVYAITNFSAEMWQPFTQHFAFTQLFQDVLVSGEVQLVKPDQAIYKMAFKRFNIDPTKSLFIDDRPENVEMAEQLGMSGHIFTDTATLKADLQSRGIIF